MRAITFVKYNDWVSTILGGDQIAAALRARGHDARCVSPEGLRDVRDAIVVFVKVSRWSDVLRARLRRNRTVLDVHDVLVFDGKIKHQRLFDGIIWRSRRQFTDFGRTRQQNRVILQHWDARYGPNRLGGGRLAIGYFGNANSFRLWGKVPGVDCVSIAADAGNASFDRARDYNCHVSVREPGREHLYKPNVKVSTAAACEANLITTRDEATLDLLGADYPYYIDAPELPALLAGIEKARATFGGPEWREGLGRMREVRDKTSLAREIDAYLAYFAELG